jgi:hypothetical protein
LERADEKSGGNLFAKAAVDQPSLADWKWQDVSVSGVYGLAE